MLSRLFLVPFICIMSLIFTDGRTLVFSQYAPSLFFSFRLHFRTVFPQLVPILMILLLVGVVGHTAVINEELHFASVTHGCFNEPVFWFAYDYDYSALSFLALTHHCAVLRRLA